ncbi:hypothetical protein R6Q59_014905 [Mikania micrantha]
MVSTGSFAQGHDQPQGFANPKIVNQAFTALLTTPTTSDSPTDIGLCFSTVHLSSLMSKFLNFLTRCNLYVLKVSDTGLFRNSLSILLVIEVLHYILQSRVVLIPHPILYFHTLKTCRTVPYVAYSRPQELPDLNEEPNFQAYNANRIPDLNEDPCVESFYSYENKQEFGWESQPSYKHEANEVYSETQNSGHDYYDGGHHGRALGHLHQDTIEELSDPVDPVRLDRRTLFGMKIVQDFPGVGLRFSLVW